LSLAEEGEPFRRLYPDVKSETSEQIGIVCCRVLDAIFTFEARPEFTAELNPAGQSPIEFLQGKHPGSGSVRVGCSLRVRCFAFHWLGKDVADAKDRKERDRASDCHICCHAALMERQGQNLNVSFLHLPLGHDPVEARRRHRMST
jgi:hypothetical protein